MAYYQYRILSRKDTNHNAGHPKTIVEMKDGSGNVLSYKLKNDLTDLELYDANAAGINTVNDYDETAHPDSHAVWVNVPDTNTAGDNDHVNQFNKVYTDADFKKRIGLVRVSVDEILLDPVVPGQLPTPMIRVKHADGVTYNYYSLRLKVTNAGVEVDGYESYGTNPPAAYDWGDAYRNKWKENQLRIVEANYLRDTPQRMVDNTGINADIAAELPRIYSNYCKVKMEVRRKNNGSVILKISDTKNIIPAVFYRMTTVGNNVHYALLDPIATAGEFNVPADEVNYRGNIIRELPPIPVLANDNHRGFPNTEAKITRLLSSADANASAQEFVAAARKPLVNPNEVKIEAQQRAAHTLIVRVTKPNPADAAHPHVVGYNVEFVRPPHGPFKFTKLDVIPNDFAPNQNLNLGGFNVNGSVMQADLPDDANAMLNLSANPLVSNFLSNHLNAVMLAKAVPAGRVLAPNDVRIALQQNVDDGTVTVEVQDLVGQKSYFIGYRTPSDKIATKFSDLLSFQPIPAPAVFAPDTINGESYWDYARVHADGFPNTVEKFSNLCAASMAPNGLTEKILGRLPVPVVQQFPVPSAPPEEPVPYAPSPQRALQAGETYFAVEENIDGSRRVFTKDFQGNEQRFLGIRNPETGAYNYIPKDNFIGVAPPIPYSQPVIYITGGAGAGQNVVAPRNTADFNASIGRLQPAQQRNFVPPPPNTSIAAQRNDDGTLTLRFFHNGVVRFYSYANGAVGRQLPGDTHFVPSSPTHNFPMGAIYGAFPPGAYFDTAVSCQNFLTNPPGLPQKLFVDEQEAWALYNWTKFQPTMSAVYKNDRGQCFVYNATAHAFHEIIKYKDSTNADAYTRKQIELTPKQKEALTRDNRIPPADADALAGFPLRAANNNTIDPASIAGNPQLNTVIPNLPTTSYHVFRGIIFQKTDDAAGNVVYTPAFKVKKEERAALGPRPGPFSLDASKVPVVGKIEALSDDQRSELLHFANAFDRVTGGITDIHAKPIKLSKVPVINNAISLDYSAFPAQDMVTVGPDQFPKVTNRLNANIFSNDAGAKLNGIYYVFPDGSVAFQPLILKKDQPKWASAVGARDKLEYENIDPIWVGRLELEDKKKERGFWEALGKGIGNDNLTYRKYLDSATIDFTAAVPKESFQDYQKKYKNTYCLGDKKNPRYYGERKVSSEFWSPMLAKHFEEKERRKKFDPQDVLLRERDASARLGICRFGPIAGPLRGDAAYTFDLTKAKVKVRLEANGIKASDDVPRDDKVPLVIRQDIVSKDKLDSHDTVTAFYRQKDESNNDVHEVSFNFQHNKDISAYDEIVALADLFLKIYSIDPTKQNGAVLPNWTKEQKQLLLKIIFDKAEDDLKRQGYLKQGDRFVKTMPPGSNPPEHYFKLDTENCPVRIFSSEIELFQYKKSLVPPPPPGAGPPPPPVVGGPAPVPR